MEEQSTLKTIAALRENVDARLPEKNSCSVNPSLSLFLSRPLFLFVLSYPSHLDPAYLHVLHEYPRIIIRGAADGAAECRRTRLIVDVINNTVNDTYFWDVFK